MAPIKDFLDAQPHLLIRCKSVIESLQAYKYICSKPFEADTERGLYIVGPSCTGKSRGARKAAQRLLLQIFLKTQSKWFCGYDGEPIILLEDFDIKGSCLSHFFKLWPDRHSCKGEIKGGTVAL